MTVMVSRETVTADLCTIKRNLGVAYGAVPVGRSVLGAQLRE